jgi:hypothetical protein
MRSQHEVDHAVLEVIDEDAELVDRVEARLRARDNERVSYRGLVETTRAIRDCIIEDERRRVRKRRTA